MKNILIITPYYPFPQKENLIQDTKAVYYLCKESNENERIIIAYYYQHSRLKAYCALPRLLRKMKWQDCYYKDDNGHEVLLLEHPGIIPHDSQTLSYFDGKYGDIINDFLQENGILLDSIVVHFPLQFTDICKKIDAKKRIAIVHSYDVKKDELLNITIRNLPFYDKVGFRSKQIEDKCRPYIDKQETFLCLSGIPDYMLSEKREEKKWKKNGILRLIYAGKLDKNKNVVSIINALGLISKEVRFEFTVVGDGSERNRLVKLSEKLGIEEKVQFLGKVSREDVFEIMKMADAFIMTSYKETLGLVYFEAMAAGNVVIASRGTGIDGIVTDYAEALLVSPDSVEDIASKINELYFMSDEQISDMREKAYGIVRNLAESQMSREYLDRM